MEIAIIAGTGIDDTHEFAPEHVIEVSTPFGSCAVSRKRFAGTELAFIARHGFDHSVPPSLVNYRAQIAALKKVGVNRVIGVCTVGSLTSKLPPGSFAVLTDFIDLTRTRITTFFDQPGGPVVHTDFSQPYCPELTAALTDACQAQGLYFESKGIYLAVEGPRYETPAEIRLYASWGAHVVGMTNVPEVVLAREAGLCYGALAFVSNLACGLSQSSLSHEGVKESVRQSASSIISVLRDVIRRIPQHRKCKCSTNNELVL
ncbi:MAG: MTAP family purine nucleoside phosphorylase [Armatimonadetes bacterium]|nr:MTAP family purine nucleoside phosphorylase [Armatimonadota bacterium]